MTKRIGRFELANHGTLFLDEIGEVPPEIQPKLLHVMQEQEFERLGSSHTMRTDARFRGSQLGAPFLVLVPSIFEGDF